MSTENTSSEQLCEFWHGTGPYAAATRESPVCLASGTDLAGRSSLGTSSAASGTTA